MDVTALLTGETGLTLLGGVLGAVWTAFKSSEWHARARALRLERAVEALEAGVEATYRAYVQGIKAGREDGRLTDAEREHARDMALRAAFEYGRGHGIDVARELGRDYLDLWLTRVVNRMKR